MYLSYRLQHTDYFSKRHLTMSLTIVPYVHEAKSSDVGGVCVIDETHQLFASQLEGKQFVQKTESC